MEVEGSVGSKESSSSNRGSVASTFGLPMISGGLPSFPDGIVNLASCWQSYRMPSYRGYRFPPEIISHAVWLYHRFALSFRDVEDVLARRGVEVTYEAIRKWCRRFGPEYAGRLRRRRGRLGDTWHLDEVCSSRSRVASNTCGAPWMRTVTSSTSSCNRDGIGTPRCASFASY